MQLAITVLGNNSNEFIVETLSAVSICQCNVMELRSSSLTHISGLYLLIDGNWNYIAKLEAMLDTIAKRLAMQICFLRPEIEQGDQLGVPYTLETISMEKKDLLFAITSFLVERGILIEEMNANRHQTAFINNVVFSTKFIILVPGDVRVLSLREEFLDFCDSLNIDAILEPIKR